jgi:hypothetical protein
MAELMNALLVLKCLEGLGHKRHCEGLKGVFRAQEVVYRVQEGRSEENL